MDQKVQIPLSSLPQHAYTLSATVQVPHQNGTFIMSDEPTLTQDCHPKSTLTLVLTLGVVHSIFQLMYNDMCSPLQYHIK